MSERTIDDILSDFANATGECEALRCQGMSSREQTMRADELRAELNARFTAARREVETVTRERDLARIDTLNERTRRKAVEAERDADVVEDTAEVGTEPEREDARIAELEKELHETCERQLPLVRLRDEAYRQRDEARAERDAAWRALERERAANDTRIEYGTEPRGVVISGTLEEGA